jgi:hypothetical protein
MDWKTVLNFVVVLSWPIVVVVVLLVFRKPLATFIAVLGGRITRLSAFNFSIELASLPSPPSPWSDPSISQSAELTSGDVYSTSLEILFKLATPGMPSMSTDRKDAWDYLLVDVREGQFWFISRVFIFTVFLQALRGVRCVVFVETRGEYRRRLIGLASPEAVRAALAKAYPWFERSLQNAMVKHEAYRFDYLLNPSIAGLIIRSFIEDPEMRLCAPPAPPHEPSEWTRLGTQSIWEHTNWLTLEKVNRDLRKCFYEWDSSHYQNAIDAPAEKYTRELSRHKAPYIALVNSKEEFQRLIDRQKLVEQIIQSIPRE